VFLASLKLLEPEIDAQELASPFVQPNRPANEKPWVSDLISEYF
jgi:hypothetical protein